jgi:hypothetical protein
LWKRPSRADGRGCAWSRRVLRNQGHALAALRTGNAKTENDARTSADLHPVSLDLFSRRSRVAAGKISGRIRRASGFSAACSRLGPCHGHRRLLTPANSTERCEWLNSYCAAYGQNRCLEGNGLGVTLCAPMKRALEEALGTLIFFPSLPGQCIISALRIGLITAEWAAEGSA